MADIIGLIDKVEDDSYDGKDFKKVTLKDGQVLKVKQGREGSLKAKWDLLQWGVAIKFTMTDFTKPDGVKIPFVSNIETVEGALPEPTEPKILPEHKEAIDASRKAVREVAPQERGMWYKQLGDDLRSGHIDIKTPQGKLMRAAYFAEMLRVLDIHIKEDKATTS